VSVAGESFVPVILAAGRGSRMGGPKAVLDIAGKSALRRCLETCRRAAERVPLATPIVVSGHGGDRVRAELEQIGMDHLLVRNPDPDRGQTSSLQTGLAALPASASGWLTFPVDHPLAGAECLVALARAAAVSPSALVVLPSHKGRAGHPALIRRLLLPDILALGPDDPLRDLLRAHRAQTVFVTLPDRGILLDLDTPDDLAAAVEFLRQRPATE